jgi:drug/metabolite transporter (DMT)-like permease
MRPDVLALAAIALWASLAALGVALAHLPPFLLTGLGLLVGSVIALPLSGWRLSAWRVPRRTLMLGVYGLFGFHFLLFLALRHAPPLQANLVNYLWPLGMVVMAPWLLPAVRFRWQYLAAGLMGFAGAALAIASRGQAAAGDGFEIGYLFALASAFVWASYSLLTQRVPRFPTASVGSFAAVSGGLSLLCHFAFEPSVSLSARDALLIALLGIGPLGGAFFLWDAALKRGDARRIGLLAFLTPLLSTAVLIVVHGQRAHPVLALAVMLIVGAAAWGARLEHAAPKGVDEATGHESQHIAAGPR